MAEVLGWILLVGVVLALAWLGLVLVGIGVTIWQSWRGNY